MIVKKSEEIHSLDFISGVTLLVDKPYGWTSFDVVGKIRGMIRKKLQIKKIRVGHAGTLDPLATGLLIIAIGKDTQKIGVYQENSKKYIGTLQLGATTPSADSETEPDRYFPTEHIDPAKIEAVRTQFIGKIEQKPPIYSALKVDGMRAYKLAREGVDFEIKSRKVEIYSFEITQIKMPNIEFSVHCQKGTYIRSLARDFGETLGSGAFLSSLCRTAIGDHELKDAWTIEGLENALFDYPDRIE